MKRTIKYYLAGLAIAALILPGCKKFLDVNENPNATEKAGEAQILPAVQANAAYVTGQYYQVFGGMWAQYWTQSQTSNQYKTIDSYASTASDFNTMWSLMYAGGLSDTDSLISKRFVKKTANYAAIGYAMRAYIFQLLTDAFGDIPLKEALKGDKNLSPTYDTQKEVYDSIFVWLDRSISLADPDSDFTPGTDDLMGGGDMEFWIQFANTLKLRAYMRLSEVDAPRAQAGIAAMYAAGAEFLSGDARVEYNTAGGNQNPLYAEMVGLSRVQNIRASSTAVDKFKANADPRLTKFYTLVSGVVQSTRQGSFDTTNTLRALSRPSPLLGGDARTDASASAPVKLISEAESYFLQAEAAARTWGTGNAQALYEAGIRASFLAYGLTTANANTYIAGAGKWPGGGIPAQVKAIITQKYFAMCGNQNFEAWSEYRRTGYPDFLLDSYASVLPAGVKPARFLYPQTEQTRNRNFPGNKKIDEKVWWDK